MRTLKRVILLQGLLTVVLGLSPIRALAPASDYEAIGVYHLTKGSKVLLDAGFTLTLSSQGGLVNGDFEDGRSGWVEFSSSQSPLIMDSNLPHEVRPHSGRWLAWLGGVPNELSYIEQQVTVPPAEPYLGYWYWIQSEEFSCQSDTAQVLVDGLPLHTLLLCQTGKTVGWVQHSLDLGGYGGRSVTLRFQAETNGHDNSNLFIDDVSLHGRYYVYVAYLPFLLRVAPPQPPTLQPINNPDGDGAYTVQWSASQGALGYRLQEARDRTCQDWSEVYAGQDTSHNVAGRGAARYCYRVQAWNANGASAWSNVEQVHVLFEAEPNNGPEQCNGPLVSGRTYRGSLPAGDGNDYYCFVLPAPHTVQITLSHIPAGQDYDLALRDEGLDPPVEVSDKTGNADEAISTGVLPAGRYYIQVYQLGQTGSSQPYNLWLSFE